MSGSSTSCWTYPLHLYLLHAQPQGPALRPHSSHHLQQTLYYKSTPWRASYITSLLHQALQQQVTSGRQWQLHQGLQWVRWVHQARQWHHSTCSGCVVKLLAWRDMQRSVDEVMLPAAHSAAGHASPGLSNIDALEPLCNKACVHLVQHMCNWFINLTGNLPVSPSMQPCCLPCRSACSMLAKS